jgi:hypothetical protein
MSGICPSCGEEFDKPGLHWSHGTCPYPEISPIQEAVFEGLLMGDGSIPKQSGGNSALLHLPMINRRFLEWIDERLGILTTGVSLKKTASELASNNRESGFSPNAKEERYHDMYTIWTRTHPYFEDLRERWYPDRNKQFPDDLELTPLRAKLWYLCDGYLDVGQHGRPRIEIKARNEEKRAEFLVGLFEDVGFSPLYKRHELRFTCDETEDLVEWMGDPLPGFEYKWALGSREQYHELKQEAYEEHATQTIEVED